MSYIYFFFEPDDNNGICTHYVTDKAIPKKFLTLFDYMFDRYEDGTLTDDDKDVIINKLIELKEKYGLRELYPNKFIQLPLNTMVDFSEKCEELEDNL